MSEIIKLKVEYKIGDEVYLKTDPDQKMYIVTGLRVRPKDVSYELSRNGEEIIVYDIELTNTADDLIKLGLTPKEKEE